VVLEIGIRGMSGDLLVVVVKESCDD
jgi:hypothetical protein